MKQVELTKYEYQYRRKVEKSILVALSGISGPSGFDCIEKSQ